MAKTYTELLGENFARQIEFLNIKKYHEMDFKGKGITILNAEGAGDHREMTSQVIRDYVPEANLLESSISVRTSGDKVLEATVTINGEKIDFEQAIDKYNIKIITRSYEGSSSAAFLNYLKDIQKRKDVIFFCSAGNLEDHIGVWSKNNTAITVSASKLKEDGTIVLSYYGGKSAEEEEIDFTCFMARGQGTSAASPALAAMVALLLQRYGYFNQLECVELLKSLCIDLGDIGRDNRHGWGLPVLPLTDRLEILDNMRKGAEYMEFADVNVSDWFKDAVEKAANEGLVQGYEDGTFKPNKSITRAEAAVLANRILDKAVEKMRKEL